MIVNEQAVLKAKLAMEQLSDALTELATPQPTMELNKAIPIAQLGEMADLYRRDHKLSKADMALMAGVSHVTFKKFEDDPESMRVDKLMDILATLGMTLYAGPIGK